MSWNDIIFKGEMEWYEVDGIAVQFNTPEEAEKKARTLNRNRESNSPIWRVTTIFPKPMIRRMWLE